MELERLAVAPDVDELALAGAIEIARETLGRPDAASYLAGMEKARAVALRLEKHRVIEVEDIEKIAELINDGVTEARTIESVISSSIGSVSQ